MPSLTNTVIAFSFSLPDFSTKQSIWKMQLAVFWYQERIQEIMIYSTYSQDKQSSLLTTIRID